MRHSVTARLLVMGGLTLGLLIPLTWVQSTMTERAARRNDALADVGATWGGPQTINTSFTKDGIRQEEWIFEDWESAAIVKHRYLYFEEGMLIGGWFQGSGERLPTQSPSNPHIPRQTG